MIDKNMWDYIKTYLDTRINATADAFKNIFDEYSVKTTVTNIDAIKTTANISTEVTNVSNIKDQVVTVSDNKDNVVIVANDITNVNTNANNISDINTNANNIDNIISTGSNIDSVNTNANNINSINTNATNIESINTVNTNINSVNITANSIDDVNTYAKTYLGAKDTDPDKRNDGTDLLEGDLYFNTKIDKMKVFNGDIWQLASSAINGLLKTQSWIADGDTNTFTVDDGYDANFAQVFLNGSNVTNDVDISDGQTIVFDTTPNKDSEILGIFFGSFELADTYTRIEIDRKTVNIDLLHTNSDSNITIGKKYFIDTTDNTVTLTLPDTANDGEQILIYDSARNFNNNNCILHNDNDDNTINLSNDDLELDVIKNYIIIYNSNKSNWEVY